MTERSFSARLACRCLLQPSDAGGALIVALHGFGSSPEVMLRLTSLLTGPRHTIASLEGPNQFLWERRTAR